jgi:hypothetical protein
MNEQLISDALFAIAAALNRIGAALEDENIITAGASYGAPGTLSRIFKDEESKSKEPPP